MKEKEKNSIQFFVPPNVSARFEIIEGFGVRELIICIITIAIGLLLTFATNFITTKQTIKVEELSAEERLEIEEGIEEITKSTPIIPTPVRVIVFIAFPTAVTFLIVRKNPITGMSVSELIKGRNQFCKRQKRYLYKYNSGG